MKFKKYQANSFPRKAIVAISALDEMELKAKGNNGTKERNDIILKEYFTKKIK